MKIVLAIAVIVPVLATAQLSETDIRRQLGAMDKQLQLTPFIAQMESGSVDSNRLAVIHAMLKHTSEVRIHQQKGASGNKVFVHQDGHKEAVYDEDGKLVKDGVNDGSYNYFHPSKKPLAHFAFDISPWILWGQSQTDSTTVNERIYAYLGDLEGGIRRALADKERSWKGGSLAAPGQRQTLAIFLRAIEAGNAESLFTLFESDAEPSDKDLIDVLTKLNRGFETVYAAPK